VARAAHALQSHGDGPRRADLHHQVHRANIDSQFQRGGRDQHFDFAIFEFFLRRQTQFAREAAVMGCDVVRPEFLRQMMRDSLRQSPGIYEDQRGAMLFDQLDQTVVDLVPHFVGGDGAELAGRNFDGKIELALVADVDDHRVGPSAAGKEMRDLFNRLLRRRKSNTHWRTIRQRFQPL
jgi:hypothetical protein